MKHHRNKIDMGLKLISVLLMRGCPMSGNMELNELQTAYKQALDAWMSAIRKEEDLASVDHSMVALEKWDEAGFEEADARAKADAAKEAYKDGLRRILYNM